LFFVVFQGIRAKSTVAFWQLTVAQSAI